jgi:hypothetical protein
MAKIYKDSLNFDEPPGDEMVNEIESWGLKPPPTKISCINFIAFIKWATKGADEKYLQERIALVKKIQEKWLSKEVRAKRKSMECLGVVEYVYIISYKAPAKFMAIIIKKNGSKITRSVSSLEVIAEKNKT